MQDPSNAPDLSTLAPDPVPLIPARMVNEFAYCPRLAYLMWTQAEWSDTGDTVEGRRVHARVDRPSAPLPSPAHIESDDDESAARSLTLSSESLGVVAKIDVVETKDGAVVPVDYKRSKRPHVDKGAYLPERIQVCLQALLLEEHGYRVDVGAIYYAGSRERVPVVLDGTLRTETKDAVESLRRLVRDAHIPPPLEDSPKCPRCALVSVCLPDEVRLLAGGVNAPRPISVPVDEALPLIVQSQQARITKDGETLKILDEDREPAIVRLNDVSDLALFGNATITTPALAALFEREIPITFHSHGGWFRGMAQGVGHRNVEVRTAQYRASFDEAFCLRFSRTLVQAKITNQRTILRRNWRGDMDARDESLNHLEAARRTASQAGNLASLLGAEGDGAAAYFRAFARLLSPPGKTSSDESGSMFRFDRRNRRPPTDPVNAMLSLGYAMLTRHLTIAVASVGLDPFRGFFHAPRYGRPALALDLMEPFRPIVADSVVLTAINTGEISIGDFVVGATGTALSTVGRRKFIDVFERRLSQETTHPLFGYKLSMRRLILVQARLLTRHLLGEIETFPHYLPR